MPTFNLIDCPWLPVATGLAAQPLAQMSLRDVFARAHQVQGIDASSPLLTAALYRLLLAILHRADAVHDGRINLRALDAYWARWHGRFDLFDREHPFHQCPALAAYPKAVKSPTQLTIWRASDRNRPRLHDQSSPTTHLSFAEAALGLILIQSYATGGLVSYDDAAHKSARAAPLVGVGVWRVVGPTLLQILLANCLPSPTITADCPAWERDPALAAEERLPRGPCDWFTWQSRRILLCSQGEEVTGVITMKGDQTPAGGDAWQYDPQVARTTSSIPISPHTSSPFLCLDTVLTSLPVLTSSVPYEGDVLLDVAWVVTHQVKYTAWHQRRLRVPARILSVRSLWQPILHDAIALAQTLEPLLTGAPVVIPVLGTVESPMRLLVRLAPQRESERKAAPLRYWSELDTQFRLWLEAIASGILDSTTARASWQDTAQMVARHAFQGSLSQIPNAPRRADVCEPIVAHLERCLAALTENIGSEETPC